MFNNVIFTMSGKAGSGKDTIGEMFRVYCKSINLEPFTLAFADQLKDHCRRNFNYVDKTNDRHILQEFGQKVRDLEPNFWALQVYHTIDRLKDMFDVFIITDCRYENEKSLFPYNVCYPIVNVYIKRDVESNLSEDEYNHESEKMAENFDENQYHFVIDNNGSIEDTYKQVVHIVDEVILNKEKYVKKYDNLNESDSSYLNGILNALVNTTGGANDNE